MDTVKYTGWVPAAIVMLPGMPPIPRLVSHTVDTAHSMWTVGP